MLSELKQVQENLFSQSVIVTFWNKYGVHAIIKQLNKSTKQQTKQRIKFFFYKISNHKTLYHEFLKASLTNSMDEQKQFIKYVSGQYSQQYYNLLLQKWTDVMKLFHQNPLIIPIIIKLMYYEYGIKIIKLMTKLYINYSSQYECLFQQEMKQLIQNGLKNTQNSISQIRFVQLVANISIIDGKCFKFVSNLLNQSLNLYQTQDILIKLNLVQIISNLGSSMETSEMVRNHKIWKYIEKDATNQNSQFYVRKHLLIMLIQMAFHKQFDITPKLSKNIISFLLENIKYNGEYLQAALEIISHLFRNAQGCSIVMQNSQLFTKYIQASRSTRNSVKIQYLQSIVLLTETQQETAAATEKSSKYHLILNVLNCIGSPNLSLQASHSLQAKSHLIQGIANFCKWFTSYIILPFQEIEQIILEIFLHFLNFTEILIPLVQNQEVSKYLLKTLDCTNSDKNIRIKKNKLIQQILYRGKTQWKGQQLSQYARMLGEQIKTNKIQMEIALDVE